MNDNTDIQKYTHKTQIKMVHFTETTGSNVFDPFKDNMYIASKP